MDSIRAVTLLDAASQYISSLKTDDNPDQAQRELFRFVHWCGPGRVLPDITPPQLDQYVEQVGGTGSTPQAADRLHVVRRFLSYAKKKGLIEKNMAQHVRIRKSNRGRKGPQQSGAETIELTRDGHTKLVAEMEKLKAARSHMAEQIKKAAADKDVRENVPLEAAREELGHAEARIKSIENTLRSAVIIDSSGNIAGGAVKIGAKVSVKDLSSGRETSYMLVHQSEANPLDGKISDASPLGKAIIRRSVGQEVEVATPRGEIRFRITKVSK